MDDGGFVVFEYPMTMIVDRFPYPLAILRDQNKGEVATGVARVDTKRRQATFFPSKKVNVNIVLKKAAFLEVEDETTYPVLQIEYTEIPQWGYASPHYEIDIGNLAT